MSQAMRPTLQFYLDPSVKERGIAFAAPRAGDAGFDLRSSEDVVIEPGAQVLVPTGLKVAIPEGFVGFVKDRSSVALKQVRTHAGVIDAGYRGEVKIVVSNSGRNSFQIEAGTKIAQMVVLPIVTSAEEVNSESDLGKTARGEGGFGSTGN